VIRVRGCNGELDSEPMARSRRIDITGAFARSAAFLSELGITISLDPTVKGFLRNVAIDGGALVVASYDDDVSSELLHEAGHLAVIPSVFRGEASGDLSNLAPLMDDWFAARPRALELNEDPIARGILQCGECEAVAWSYAAAHAIGIDTRIPFRRGFEGTGLALHDQVASGYYFGVHGLAAGGMTELPRFQARTPFPAMKRWLQV